MTEVKKCNCGTAYGPQIKSVRVPGTFKAIIYVYFCMGGCHREGVGTSEEQAAREWNATFLTPATDDTRVAEKD